MIRITMHLNITSLKVSKKTNFSGATKIRILDSTLREGEQHPGVSFTVKQRIQIAWELDYFGVDQIEISPIIFS